MNRSQTQPRPTNGLSFTATLRRVFSAPLLLCGAVAALLSSCASSGSPNEIRVSVRDQKMALMKDGKPVKVYKVSTSKFGLGDKPGSYATPLGKMKIAQKIGHGQPAGRVFHSRKPSREIVAPNSPGRDPIVSRILWLRGTEKNNAKAFGRFIYIHGTPEERNIGRPASYGCVRMKSKDVIDLFNRVPVGLTVNIIKGSLNGEAREVEAAQLLAENSPPPTAAPQPMLPPMAPKVRPGQSASANKMVAQNGKPRLGPAVASTPSRNKRSAAN
jgi:hypothetical protein